MTGEAADRMRAVRLRGPNDVRLERLPVPTPGPGEVRVRVEAALTGGTVRKLVRRGYHATLGTPPLTLGHEAAGVISAVGEGVTGWQVGDRVVPANSAPDTDGLPVVWSVGAFADEWIVPAAIVDANLHRVPEGAALEAVCLAESLATVLKGFDHTPTGRGSRVTVLGLGALGLLWIQVLHRAGAVVTAVSRTATRADAARALGASDVRTLDAHNASLADAAERTPLVVEAVGSIEAWDFSLRCVAPRGCVHFFGGPPKGTTITVDTQRLHYEELHLTASFHHTPAHFARAVDLLATGEIDAREIVGPAIGLADVPAWLTGAPGGSHAKTRVVPSMDAAT